MSGLYQDEFGQVRRCSVCEEGGEGVVRLLLVVHASQACSRTSLDR